MKAITADSSSRYAIFTSSKSTFCPKNLLCAHWALSIMKYLYPKTPPHPKLVEASINYSFFPRGSFPKIKSKDRPWFFVKIIRHTNNALYIAFVILIDFFAPDGVIFSDNTDRKGLPKGAIHCRICEKKRKNTFGELMTPSAPLT